MIKKGASNNTLVKSNVFPGDIFLLKKNVLDIINIVCWLELPHCKGFYLRNYTL